MAVSVRMEPVLEKQLELAAKRKGVTKSQFIVDAVRHALGHQDPYTLLLKVRAEAQASPDYERLEKAFPDAGFKGDVADKEARRAFIKKKLLKKHGLNTD